MANKDKQLYDFIIKQLIIRRKKIQFIFFQLYHCLI